jgi:hypothetical protein
MEREFKIKESVLQAAIECIAAAVHPGATFSQVNGLLTELSKQPEVTDDDDK